MHHILFANPIFRDDFAGFMPFLTLPDRMQLKEYYQIIQHPVSLKQIQKRVKGVVGKKAATGISEFKHWAAFEEEMSFLWKNAFQFNEDDSQIYLLAKDLQVCQSFPLECMVVTDTYRYSSTSA